jgi:cell division protein ZapA
MAKVTVKINGQTYHLACNDGEEARLQSLAAFVDDKMSEIGGAIGPAGDIRLLLMTTLVISDELMECRERMSEAELARSPGLSAGQPSELFASSGVSDMLSQLTNKIEHIAARLEKA